MPCPKCKSVYLMIKDPIGFERVRILLTRKRTYVCDDCGHYFRLKDRRSLRRDDGAAALNAARNNAGIDR